jgi:ribokinase
MAGRAVVVGAVNLDAVCEPDPIPRPGETVLGRGALGGGGKGGNQACALAAFGISTAMVSRVGSDLAGDLVLAGLRGSGVDVSLVKVDASAPTGIAFVTLLQDGENTIVVAPGANALLRPADVEAALAAEPTPDLVICQCEVPLGAVAKALVEADRLGAATVLNAAPAVPGVEHVLRHADYVIVNETEFTAISGQASVSRATVAAVREASPFGPESALVVTLGRHGVFVADAHGVTHVATPQVDTVVDSTGAGDTFCAGFAAALMEGRSLVDSVRIGAAAGAASTQVPGARVEESVATTYERALGRLR